MVNSFFTLVDLLRQRAAHQPNRLGYRLLVDGEGDEACLTYAELDQQARSIAACLQMEGATGERVLLLYPPSLDYIVAFFGCLYAGAVPVPAYPPRFNRSLLRLEVIVANAQAAVAITTRQFLDKGAKLFRQSPILKNLRWFSHESIENSLHDQWHEPNIKADTLAMLQYTSGSTGTPKGVMLTHRNLLHNSALLSQAFRYTTESQVVSWLPIYHDMGLIGGVLQPLHGGFPCTLMSPTVFLQSPVKWLRAISRYRATISGAPNFAYELCVRRIRPEQRSQLDLSSWSIAFNGSEPVRAETLERFAATFAECGFRREAFYPCYGLAEASLFVAGGLGERSPVVKAVDAAAFANNLVVPACTSEKSAKLLVGCGDTPSNQRLVIVAPESRSRCSDGEVGEIWVSGGSVAQGYWNLPEETCRTFQARLADTDEGPFLRTGDLGVVCDGELFIAGRLKNLIIIRGLNHYPEDIELTVERSHPALRPGCCAAFTVDNSGEERLVILQEIDLSQGPNAQIIIENIRQAIAAEHELQAEAVILIRPGAIPKTSSGKLQRHACQEAFLTGKLEIIAEWRAWAEVEAEQGAEAPSDVEAKALRAWLISLLANRLRVAASDITYDQPISRYGMDSLAALEVAHSIEIHFGVDLPMAYFLQDLSLRELEEKIRIGVEKSSIAGAAAAYLRTEAEYPLSRGQKAMWFLHELGSSQAAAYHIAVTARVRGDLDIKALRWAFQSLVDRHPALRTTVVIEHGSTTQRVSERSDVIFNEIEAAGWSQSSQCERLMEEFQRPFDLIKGPLLRINLFARTPREHILQLVAHHIIADFWSLVVLVRELSILYADRKGGRPVMMASPKGRYSDYIDWQESMLAGPEGERLWRYWEKKLSGELPVLNLPADRPRPPAQTYRGASHHFHLDAELTRRLRSLGQAQGATLYMVLLAAFQVLLHRHTDQEDLVVGSLSAGRKRAETADVVGYFVNPIVQRADLSGDPTFATFLERARQAVIEALDHQDFPFPTLVERLRLARDPSRSPLFQAMFVLQTPPLLNGKSLAAFALDEEGAQFEVEDLIWESYAWEPQVAQFDLTLVMAENGNRLGATLRYNTDLYDAATIEELAARFITLLNGIVADPERRLSDLPLLPDDERRRLLVEWNETQIDYPRDICIHQLFERMAARQPEMTAVVFENQRLSYGELNDRANQLARYLRKLEIGPEIPVGICMERSLEMVVGLLGILKAGGAYLPLDPSLPTKRLLSMLEDAQIPVLLAQARMVERMPDLRARSVYLDTEWETIGRESKENLIGQVTSDNLSYLIYTSGSTGKPKGVMVTHRNVVNFFKGMDARIGADEGDTLLAVTSVSFDISVLELLWTLTRGSRVVLLGEQAVNWTVTRREENRAQKELDFSLFYFASADGAAVNDKYRLLIEGAKFADRNGFAAVWTPERHFHDFGGLYPNPAVTSAALATITERVQLRAGSVVLPLHHPIRVAEEWALVDNLSRGRVAVAFASGWHADDFVFFPERYPDRKNIMADGIETVRRLWRGEAVRARGGSGDEIEVKIWPKPLQPELPIWLTAAGALETFIGAGEIGANVLTHLLGQTIEDLAKRIHLYREALAKHGRDSQAGKVTLMLHTFIGESRERVREQVRQPFTAYLRSSVGLIGNLTKSMNLPLDLKAMSEQDLDDLLAHAFERYFETSALFGTQDTCQALVERLREIGVDEIACLIDYGVETNQALAGLHHLREVKERANRRVTRDDYSLPAQASRYKPTLFQCTPSMMNMLGLDTETPVALGALRALMLGGESLPPKQACQIRTTTPWRLLNMYGPTETTIWSTTHEVTDADGTIPIGSPIANTQIYLLDRHLRLAPRGAPGEIYIGGEGVARGYFARPDLSAERFVPDQFSGRSGARLYRTGDLARYRLDGAIEFLGRSDHQVKLRGYRIELSEIEAVLGQHEGVREAVVLAHEETAGDLRLIAYCVSRRQSPPPLHELRFYLRERLPEYMVPMVFTMLQSLPRTANGKVDRKALPAPHTMRPDVNSSYVAPAGNLEQEIAAIWQEVLKLDQVGVNDSFFDIGGHSLLMAQVHSQLRERLKRDLPLVKLLEYPTVRSLASYLSRNEQEGASLPLQADRALKQREWLKRQRPGFQANQKVR